jgi:hypothetical protein
MESAVCHAEDGHGQGAWLEVTTGTTFTVRPNRVVGLPNCVAGNARRGHADHDGSAVENAGPSGVAGEAQVGARSQAAQHGDFSCEVRQTAVRLASLPGWRW